MQDLKYFSLPSVLPSIKDKTTEIQFSMGSEPLVGALLRTLAASKRHGRFLELGTGTGIATASIPDGVDSHSTLISIDRDSEVQSVAAMELGADQRLTLKKSGGLEFLRGQEAETFDFVFADALPGKYEGLEEALAVVKLGGFYVIDDMLPQSNWPEGHAAKVPALMEKLESNKNFETLPLVWARGVVVAVRKRSVLAP